MHRNRNKERKREREKEGDHSEKMHTCCLRPTFGAFFPAPLPLALLFALLFALLDCALRLGKAMLRHRRLSQVYHAVVRFLAEARMEDLPRAAVQQGVRRLRSFLTRGK